MISAVSVGGILLILGAGFIYFGKVYYSTLMYALADICWSINAYQNNDMFGFITVNIGILVGITVMYKMQKGIFHKDLKKEIK